MRTGKSVEQNEKKPKMISDKALKEFKEIWREEYGEEISDEKAVELGINLLTLFDKIYRPVKKSWMKELLEKEKNEQNGSNRICKN